MTGSLNVWLSAEKATLSHRLFAACLSLSVSVKLLYVPAAMSNVLYHSPFFTFALRGPYIVLRAVSVLKDRALGAMRTIGPKHRAIQSVYDVCYCSSFMFVYYIPYFS